jgi:HK97 family phage portal protein
MSIWDNIKSYFVVREKLNPAQELMSYAEGHVVGSKSSVSYRQAFTRLESVSRGVGLLVGACSSLDYDIKDKIGDGNYVGIRAGNLNRLLNIRPNPYQPLQEFRYNIFTDFLLEGNAFIYYDGAFLYHIPAAAMQIIPDEKTFIASYKYNGLIDFKPSEIAHFKDMNGNSIYRGHSRLEAADRNIRILYKMQDFQETFFDNGAIPGFALTTDNTLSQVSKDKTIANWMVKYNPKNGAKKPIILDSGMKPAQLFTTSFKEMDFDISVSSANVRILETIGVPPVLLDGGNQANISPNLRLFYLETVLPIVRKYVSAMEFLSGYDIEAITTTVSALQPDIKDIAAYNVGLVNGGILTANEARTELRYAKDKDPESDKLRVPANIAGSAVQPNIGGAPKKPPPQ